MKKLLLIFILITFVISSFAQTGNEMFGTQAGAKLSTSTGDYNTAGGFYTGYNLTTGHENTFLGSYAGYNSNTSYSTFLGNKAGYNSTSDQSVFVGLRAGYSATGNQNVFLGVYAGYNTTSGGNNVYIGRKAGYENVVGEKNINIGTGAGNRIKSGSNNILIGHQAGYGPGPGYHSSSGNIFIGYQAGYSELGSNKLYIENSNSTSPLIYGDFDLDQLIFNGKVGIGTTPAGWPADLNLTVSRTMNIGGTNGYIFQYDAYSGLSSRKLRIVPMNDNGLHSGLGESISISHKGQLILGHELITASEHYSDYKMSVRGKIVANEFVVVPLKGNWWPDYVFEEDYEFLSIPELESYIKQNKHLPGVPSQAEVEQSGFELAEMNAILLEKVEELSLYIITQNKEIEKLKEEVEEIRKLMNN